MEPHIREVGISYIWILGRSSVREARYLDKWSRYFGEMPAQDSGGGHEPEQRPECHVHLARQQNRQH
jgi:hypothetical protein